MASEEFLLGRCQLQLRDIEIDPDYCRDKIDLAIQTVSIPILKTTNSQYSLRTQVELRQLLEDSGVSYSSFIESQSRIPYLRLTSSHSKLRCIHARQRYEAALSSTKLGPGTWWTVKLYCLPQGVDIRALLRDEVEHDHHQTKYNDGHIFCAVLYWEEQGDPGRARSWRSKLSHQANGKVKERLKKLRAFPGLLNALELGNVERMVHSRGLPQIIRNLDHIYKTWDTITLGEARVRRAADVPTVQYLQMLATFGNHIIRSHLITTLRKGEAISQAMEALWSPPDDCLVEQCRGPIFEGSSASKPGSLVHDGSHCAALRGFPRLCDGDYMGPRCEPGERHTPASRDEIAIDYFRSLARRVGYHVATPREVPPITAGIAESAIEPAEGASGEEMDPAILGFSTVLRL
ncbi:hypothetical protein QBC46DRAFT_411395 [Diplogelasinospora grovesii]|uniref:Uncharacterized protein n=1 Tax=Diplogelasinospora grovesii TaxID=303347 RepID=A0AAN6N189_9PEZI|nr:hypothetical protein QBC46DRAFT_411395 [Diplogelasinospora grovesii]